MQKLLFLFTALLFLTNAQAQTAKIQDVSGEWQGFLDQTAAFKARGTYDDMLEFGLVEKNKPTAKIILTLNLADSVALTYKGVYRIESLKNSHIFAEYKITAAWEKGAFVFKTDTGQRKSPLFCFCSAQLQLNPPKKGKINQLNGAWKGWNADNSDCADGFLRLEKSGKIPQISPKILPIPPAVDTTPASLPAPATIFEFPPNQPIPTRKLSEKRLIEVDSQRIEIAIWDGNRIDGDTMKLFWNGQLLLDNWGLTHEKKIIILDMQTTEAVLLMQAVNLGEIVPNTATISVFDGKTRSTVELNSDLSSSELIRIRPQKRK